MKLYHYTGREHVAGIRVNGIRADSELLPGLSSRLRTTNRCAWLTASPDWTIQRWATRLSHNCDRTEIRFKISIPKRAQYIMPFLVFNDVMLEKDWPDKSVPWTLEQMTRSVWGNPEDWWVSTKPIPRGWLRGMEERPASTPPLITPILL